MRRTPRLLLNAADASLLALDRFMDSGRVGKNLVHLVVELDGAPDPATIQRGLDRFVGVTPWASSRLRRGGPLFPPYWIASRKNAPEAPPVVTHTLDTSDRSTIDTFLEDRLDDRIDPFSQAPVRFDLIKPTAQQRLHAQRHLFVLTWFHPLMDPRGAETFLLHLDRLTTEDASQVWPDGVPNLAAPARSGPLRKELQQARSGKRYLDSFRDCPPRCPSHPVAPSAPARFRLATFPAPAEVDRKSVEMTWRLAVVGRTIRRVFGDRIGTDPFVLPISVDLRKKGEPGPVFGNHLSLHFAKFNGSDDTEENVKELRTQMIDVMRDGRLDATMAAIHLIRGLPVPLLARRMAASTRGGLASFHFADTGDYRGASPTLFGQRVDNAYHIPTVTPKPGLGVFINRHGDNENIVVGWRDGGIDKGEVDALIADIADSLGWTSLVTPKAEGRHS